MDIQDRLTKYMDELEKALSKSAEFATTEAPLVVKEFLAWEFWSSVMGMVACFSVVAFLSVVTYRNRKMAMRQLSPEASDIGPMVILPLVFGGSVFAICLAIGCVSTVKVVKVTVAPRLVILEKVSELAHGKSK